MKKVAIIHELFEEAGGGEVLSFYLYKALKELGFDVSYYTFYLNKDAFNIIKENTGVEPEITVINNRFTNKINERFSRFVRLRRLISYDIAFSEMNKIKDDNTITINTQSNIASGSDISYIHYPAILDYEAESGSFLRYLYNLAVKLEIKKLSLKAKNSKLILTNSQWTKTIISHVYKNSRIEVLYPPIGNDLKQSEVLNKNVLTVSRFSPEKNLDKIVDIAKELNDFTFYIVGATSKYSQPVIDKIERKIKEYNVKNVFIETNVPRKRIIELMRESTFYLHPEYPEHFGISVAEAVASGLVPVVYFDGGAYTDIVLKIHSFLAYGSIRDAVKTFTALRDRKLVEEFREKALEVGLTFLYRNFKHRLASLLLDNYFA